MRYTGPTLPGASLSRGASAERSRRPVGLSTGIYTRWDLARKVQSTYHNGDWLAHGQRFDNGKFWVRMVSMRLREMSCPDCYVLHAEHGLDCTLCDGSGRVYVIIDKD